MDYIFFKQRNFCKKQMSNSGIETIPRHRRHRVGIGKRKGEIFFVKKDLSPGREVDYTLEDREAYSE